MPPSERVFELVIRKYFDKGNTKEVNYFNFCKDVDRPEDMFPGYSPKNQVPLLSNEEQKTGQGFFAGSTRDINVLESRFSQPPVNIANDPTDVEDRLRAMVVMKRVRIEEFFRDFDKLRKGKVTINQFTSILSMLNFNLTDAEFSSLALQYKTNDPDNQFDYFAFCKSINQAFTTQGIDKDPTVTVKPVNQEDTFLARRKYLEISEEDQKNLDDIMEQYRVAVQNRRINLKPQFQDFDVTKNGHVTKMQFLRVLAQLGIYAPESVLQLVLKKFMDRGNIDEVNYVDFCNFVDRPEDMFGVGRDYNQSFQYFPRNQQRKVDVEIVKLKPDNLDDVIARIRLFCKQQRTRISEFFRDFDKLRSGFITESQFRIGLNMAKIVLSQAEFDELVTYFQAPKEGKHVKWREFCDLVDEVFTKKGLEKAVDTVLDEPKLALSYGRTGASKPQRNVAEEIVQRFRSMLVRQRLDAKSFFQDWDRHKHFKVSPKQFRQVLANFGFLMSDAELEALVRTYGNEQQQILYMDFISDANPNRATGPSDSQGKLAYQGDSVGYNGEEDIGGLLFKIKALVKKERIRLGEFFQDHDLLRKGSIPAQKFRGVLCS